MHKRYLTLFACCAATAAIAGCGSGGGGTTTGGPGLGKGAPSPQTFSTDLNTLCKQGNAAVAQVSTDPAKSLAVVDQFLPKFEALTASGSQQAIYNKFLANVKAEIAALKAGNTTAAKAAAGKNKAYATALNAPACA